MKTQMDSEAGIGRRVDIGQGADRQRVDLGVPPIDLEAPEAVSTATFALG